ALNQSCPSKSRGAAHASSLSLHPPGLNSGQPVSVAATGTLRAQRRARRRASQTVWTPGAEVEALRLADAWGRGVCEPGPDPGPRVIADRAPQCGLLTQGSAGRWW